MAEEVSFGRRLVEAAGAAVAWLWYSTSVEIFSANDLLTPGGQMGNAISIVLGWTSLILGILIFFKVWQLLSAVFGMSVGKLFDGRINTWFTGRNRSKAEYYESKAAKLAAKGKVEEANAALERAKELMKTAEGSTGLKPAMVTGLVFAKKPATTNDIIVKWSPNPDGDNVTGYQVGWYKASWKSVKGWNPSAGDAFKVGKITQVDLSLGKAANTEALTVRVRAINANGKGKWAEHTGVPLDRLPAPPPPPTSYAAQLNAIETNLDDLETKFINPSRTYLVELGLLDPSTGKPRGSPFNLAELEQHLQNNTNLLLGISVTDPKYREVIMTKNTQIAFMSGALLDASTRRLPDLTVQLNHVTKGGDITKKTVFKGEIETEMQHYLRLVARRSNVLGELKRIADALALIT